MASKLTVSKRCQVNSTAEIIAREARKVSVDNTSLHYLNIGAPCTGAPVAAIESVGDVEQHNILSYSPTAGIAPLRQRIADMYSDNYGVSVDPGRIIVTIGASAAFFIAFDSLFDVGAKIAVPLPCYNAYLDVLSSLGLSIVDFPANPEHHFQPTVEDLDKLGDIDGLLITNPGNPTGAMIQPEKLKELVNWCLEHNVTLICDEIYHGIVYGSIDQETALKFSDQLVVINSFSKYYSMPGWRLGWMVVPDALVDPILSLAHSLFIAPPTPSQFAALCAMDCLDELDAHVRRYRNNRDILLEEMPKAGFDKFTPMDGAFYMYAHIQHLHHDSVQFCLDMIREAHVVAAPGTGFDPHLGHHYVRFSYAGTTEQINNAVKALQKWRC